MYMKYLWFLWSKVRNKLKKCFKLFNSSFEPKVWINIMISDVKIIFNKRKKKSHISYFELRCKFQPLKDKTFISKIIFHFLFETDKCLIVVSKLSTALSTPTAVFFLQKTYHWYFRRNSTASVLSSWRDNINDWLIDWLIDWKNYMLYQCPIVYHKEENDEEL